VIVRPSTRALAAAAIGLLLPWLAACERTKPTAEETTALTAAVDGYLHALAEAYSTLDVKVLEGWASPNEIAAVNKLLRDLLATGDRLDATLRSAEIENLEVFREVNATAKLVEVWDVVRYDATTGVVRGRTPNSIQSTLLQLRLVQGKWLVVGRNVLKRETPVAAPSPTPAGAG
jgi:hypothetical protein